MKILIPAGVNPIEAIRRCGYGAVMDRNAREPSFSRRLGRGLYPRFHAYLNGQEINLHLDQKQASYEGYARHSGEYDGEVVEREGQRLSEQLARLTDEKNPLPAKGQSQEKRGFWRRFF